MTKPRFYKLRAGTEQEAIIEGKNLCACYQKSFNGVRWVEKPVGTIHEWTWTEFRNKVIGM